MSDKPTTIGKQCASTVSDATNYCPQCGVELKSTDFISEEKPHQSLQKGLSDVPKADVTLNVWAYIVLIVSLLASLVLVVLFFLSLTRDHYYADDGIAYLISALLVALPGVVVWAVLRVILNISANVRKLVDEED